MQQQHSKILDIGCGKNKIDGAIGVDFNSNTAADVIHNLNVFPYPFDENEFDVMYCRHVLEHLDNLVLVMEELYRIGKPNAAIYIDVPYFSGIDAYNDPTHKRFFTSRSFDYFTGEFRELDYYSKAHFKKKAVRIEFWSTRSGFTPQNVLGFGLFANKFTKFYEIFLANIFPARMIHYELEIIK